MFTGIIDHVGTLVQIESIPDGMRFSIKHTFSALERGESIAIDGVCLTVTHFYDDIFCCDVSPETLNITNLNKYKVGYSVNLERALLPSSRIGGHFVMGHVDQTAWVKSIRRISDFIEMTFAGLDDESLKYIVKKGSIAINGVSLTINQLSKDGFNVMLIPHTLERTNLEKLQEKDTVNIEFDILARMVVRQIENVTP